MTRETCMTCGGTIVRSDCSYDDLAEVAELLGEMRRKNHRPGCSANLQDATALWLIEPVQKETGE